MKSQPALLAKFTKFMYVHIASDSTILKKYQLPTQNTVEEKRIAYTTEE
jgi:hypothetical protein